MKNFSPKNKKLMIAIVIGVILLLVALYFYGSSTSSQASENSTDTGSGSGTNTNSSTNSGSSSSETQTDVEKYAGWSKEDIIADYISRIRAYDVWFNNVKEKANNNGATLDEQLRADAIYMLSKSGVSGF